MPRDRDSKSQLERRGLTQDISQPSAKRMLAYQIEREMAHQNITRVEMARRMNTSRAALNRLLDPENNSATLQSIEAAADVLGLNIVITLMKREK